MTQNRYSLSDSDMLGIFEQIELANGGNDLIIRSVKAIWNAILGQDGKSWDDFNGDNSLVPGDYAIPQDQMVEIGERIKRHAQRLGISEIGITNIMLDVITNYGPSTYESVRAEFVFGTMEILPPPSTD